MHTGAQRRWWLARIAGLTALASALLWLQAPTELWALSGTVALIGHRLAFGDSDEVLRWLHRLSALGLGGLLLLDSGTIPVALCWPVLAWLLGPALVPAGFAAASVHAGLATSIPAWGIGLGAAALAVRPGDRVGAAVLGGLILAGLGATFVDLRSLELGVVVPAVSRSRWARSAWKGI